MSRFLRTPLLQVSRRSLSTTARLSAFATGPAPPRLPPKEQEEFERLQRASTGAFSTPRPSVTVNQTSSSRPQVNQAPATSQNDISPKLSAEDIEVAAVNARVEATGKGQELHPDIRRGAKPEFEGDVNPKTGEIGGPKNEPLRWGSTGDRGDWSYNGRVTDF
jgi:hypothetical protein